MLSFRWVTQLPQVHRTTISDDSRADLQPCMSATTTPHRQMSSLACCWCYEGQQCVRELCVNPVRGCSHGLIICGRAASRRMIYNMCTQKPPHDYSEQLYSRYRDAFNIYINETVCL